MKYRVTVQPTAQPISLDEARTHLRVTPFGSPLAHPDDAYISALIAAAREWCEEYLRRALSTQTIELGLDEFPTSIELPLAPVQSVESIIYIDNAGAEQTVATSVYTLDTYNDTIELQYNQSWPATRTQDNAITVTIVVGYTNGESPDTFPFPSPIKAAMLLIIGNLYENRVQDAMSGSRLTFNSLPLGVYSLLQPYRLGLGL
jgi:uncharacterized phiE125 gp8 family phage protein